MKSSSLQYCMVHKSPPKSSVIKHKNYPDYFYSVYKKSFGSMETKKIDSCKIRAPLQRVYLSSHLKAMGTMEPVTA